MTSTKQQATDNFRMVLITVVGLAFEAAGYRLVSTPVKQAGGLFRFKKNLDNDLSGFIEFQLLYLPQSEWSGNIKSRFQVFLIRTDKNNVQERSHHPQYIRKSLAELVVTDFSVPILPSAGYWWQFSNTDELGKGLAEAGHLTIGYGMPWLSGELVPPST